jgi:CheY-like chemotaxis protein
MNRIYLVDDDEDDRMFTRNALENIIEKHEIIELSNGNELLTLLQKQLPEDPFLIMMDMNMPRVNGLEALSAIRKNPDFRHIPVVMFSTSASADTVRKAYEAGVNAYIVKPTTLAEYIRMAQAMNLLFFNSYPAIDPVLNLSDMEDKNVMIIEDNPDHFALMELYLKHEAPQINVIYKSTAASAADFFNSLDKNEYAAPDLIFLDLYMPTRKQGLDLLTLIRNKSAGAGVPTIPVVVMSASGDPNDIKASYRQQANAYLVKTQQPATCFSYVAKLCYFWQNTITPPTRIC